MDLGPHAFFIIAAYGVTAVIVVGLVIRAVLDHRAQVRALADLEGRGLRRRSSDAEAHSARGRTVNGDATQGRSGWSTWTR